MITILKTVHNSPIFCMLSFKPDFRKEYEIWTSGKDGIKIWNGDV